MVLVSRFSLVGAVLASTLVLLVPAVSSAQSGNDCSFGRTLSVGDTGEDVRCLQSFLNKSGVIIAQTGPGSVGNETTQFGSLTEAAVLKWQTERKVAGANGVFGPGSQAMYLIASAVQQAVLAAAPAATTSTAAPTPVVAGVSTSASAEAMTVAKTALNRALSLISEAQDAVGDVRDRDDRLDLEDDLHQLNSDLFAALAEYLDADYVAASTILKDVLLDADELIEEAEDTADRVTERDAVDAIDDAWDAYRDADDEVETEEDDGNRRADDARDLLDEARDALRDADDAYDDEDWAEAVERAKEALDLIDEALDEL